MDRAKFYAALRRDRRVFGKSLSEQQVKGMEGILDAWVNHGTANHRHLAYVFATVYHETGRKMVPVREGFAKSDAGARRAVNRLARKRGPRSAVARYAKPAGPYGHVYYGRGRVQNTWLDNYRKLSKRFPAYDFVKNPDDLLDPYIDGIVTIVGHIEGTWTGKKLSNYITAHKRDYVNARRIVNRMDKAKTIAGYALAFDDAIKAAGGIPVKSTQKPTEPQKPKDDKTPKDKGKTPPPAKSGGFLAWIFSLFTRKE